MIFDAYYDKTLEVLEKIRATQREKIAEAAAVAQKTIEAGGIIYIFGCGHSHLIALDNFYRAGGLCNVCPILDSDLMLHDGAAKSSKMEKMSGLAENILERYCLTERDCLFVVSTSGKNAVPVEMAKAARERNIPTVAVVSGAYFDDPGEKLYRCADLYIDNCVPHGDAVMALPGCDAPMGSVSTAASAFLLQSVLLEAAAAAARNGCKVPIYLSGNIEGGAEFNKTLIRAYMPRIKHL